MRSTLSTYLEPRDPWKFVQQQAEEYQKRPSIDSLPASLFTNHIFKFPSLKELFLVAGVCKKWNVFSLEKSLWNDYDLTKIFPLKVIDGKVWKKLFGLSVKDEPVLDRRTEIINLNRLFASLKLEVKSVTRLTMPAGLTFDTLEQFIKMSKQDVSICIKSDPKIKRFIDKTHIVYIANSVLKKSRNLTFDFHTKLVEHYQCQAPGPLTAATLAILTYMSSDKMPRTRLFGDAPYTYTSCSDGSIVGGFTGHSLAVIGKNNVRNYDPGMIGVTVMKKTNKAGL